MIILVVVILLVRVDLLLKLFDKGMEKYNAPEQPTLPLVIEPPSEVVSFNDDRNLKQSSRRKFLALMEDFHANPSKEVREKAIETLKADKKLLGPVLDSDFEASLFTWRDLLLQENPEVALFLLDLLSEVTGENQDAVKRFFSIMMDINLEQFIKFYSKSKDVNCTIASLLGDRIPEEEKLNELREREDSLAAYLTKENLAPNLKQFATSCQMVLNLFVSQQPAPVPAVEPVPSESSEAPIPAPTETNP